MSDRVTLKSYFQTGDVPTAANFSELIDSLKLVEETDPWFFPVHLGVATSVTSTAWQNVADLLLPKPPAEWSFDLVALIGGSKGFEFQLVDNHATVIYDFSFTSQPLEQFQFNAVDVPELQNHGMFIHLVLQVRLSSPTSPGDLQLPQLIFHAHP